MDDYRLIDIVARQLKFCCAHALLKSREGKSLRELEKELGISKTQLSFYRKEYREGVLAPCDSCYRPPASSSSEETGNLS